MKQSESAGFQVHTLRRRYIFVAILVIKQRLLFHCSQKPFLLAFIISSALAPFLPLLKIHLCCCFSTVLLLFALVVLLSSLSAHVVRQSQFKIRFKLQDWLWLSVVPSEFLPTRNLAFNGILPCC